MKVDETDRRLIFLLDHDSRATLTELAPKLKISREAVNYRIRRLVRSGVIKSFIAKLNYRKLGLVNYNIYVKLSNLKAEKRRQLVEELARRKSVTWIASLGGRFDFAIEITANSIEDFDRHFTEIFRSHADKIGNYQVQVATRIFQCIFPKKYLWPAGAEKKAEAPADAAEKPDELDVVDEKIVSVLAADARIPLVELSRRIREPPTTVSFRLRQLERRKIIVGYTSLSQLEAFGYQRFKALISVRNFSKAEEKKMLGFCSAHPNVYYFTKTLGSWNYEIEADVKTPQEYQQFLIDFRSKFGDVIHDIESLSIFEEHKFSYWPG
jgi:DNA-binding Lrp family transcriptional regulator